jgi:hypothetical protein
MSTVKSNSKGDRRPVGIRCKVELKSVDDIREEVNLYVEIILQYTDPAYANFQPDVADRALFRVCPPELQPKDLKLQILDTNKIEDVNSSKLFSTKTGMIFSVRCLRITLQEALELRRFPFDRQNVKIKMQAFGYYFQEWVGDKMDDTPMRITNDTEWCHHDHVVKNKSDAWILEKAECNIKQEENQSIFVLKFGISRDPTFYLWNVGFVHFAIVLLSTFVCAIKHTDFGARAQVTYTLLLTLVAFKFVVATFVPRISYLTYMDKYSMLSMSMLSLIIAENFIVSDFVADEINEEMWEYADRVFFAVFFGAWLLLHILLALGARCSHFYEPWDTVSEIDEIQKTPKHADFGGEECSNSVSGFEGTSPRRIAWGSESSGRQSQSLGQASSS